MRIIKICLLVLIIVLPIQTYAAENVRKITVTGKSETVVEAHYAIIKLEIKHVKKEMNQSHTELMKTVSKLTDELKNIGLKDSDIKKSLILQGQEYSWEKESRVLKGYYSACSIDLYVKDMKIMPEVYKELANYQSLTIYDTDYKRNDEFDIRKAEFEKAIQAAKKKAEYMTQSLNVKIGKVYSIHELNSGDCFSITRYTNEFREREPGEVKTGFGNIRITALVSVEFELE